MKVLITGASSGIGRELSKKLIHNGVYLWGVSRNKRLHSSLKKELNNSSRLFLTEMDLTTSGSWEKLIKKLSRSKFLPNTIIFNAALYQQDLDKKIDTSKTRLMFETNFFSIILGFNLLIQYVKPGTHFILISSSSALKGNGYEGIGYSASKAAISLAFESLTQRFGTKYSFSTIFFGPVQTNMSRIKNRPFSLTTGSAADQIINVIKNKQHITEKPWPLFLLIKLIKLLPSKIYLLILSQLEKLK